MKHTAFHTRVKERGHRMTKTRNLLLHVFFNDQHPLSAGEIGQKLKSLGVTPNKTTVYREIEFLKKQNIIQEVRLKSQTKYYELQSDHHHHIICKRCGVVEEIAVNELEVLLPVTVRKIKRKTDFNDIDHSLEFFGVCSKCNES